MVRYLFASIFLAVLMFQNLRVYTSYIDWGPVRLAENGILQPNSELLVLVTQIEDTHFLWNQREVGSWPWAATAIFFALGCLSVVTFLMNRAARSRAALVSYLMGITVLFVSEIARNTWFDWPESPGEAWLVLIGHFTLQFTAVSLATWRPSQVAELSR